MRKNWAEGREGEDRNDDVREGEKNRNDAGEGEKEHG